MLVAAVAVAMLSTRSPSLQPRGFHREAVVIFCSMPYHEHFVSLSGQSFLNQQLRLAFGDSCCCEVCMGLCSVRRLRGSSCHSSGREAFLAQVIFTDPYHEAPVNRHTSPHLDEAVAALRRDPEAKAASAAAKAMFCSRREALLHGDLHTGSIMVTADTFFVIDTEFAFCGPMAFDVGKLISNLLLTFLALDGHSTAAAPRAGQQAYVLQVCRPSATVHPTAAQRLWYKGTRCQGCRCFTSLCLLVT